MYIISIDIGNTNTSIALIDESCNTVLVCNKIATKKFLNNYRNSISKLLLHNTNSFCCIKISSVVLPLPNTLLLDLKNIENIKKVSILSTSNSLPFNIGYSPKSSVGLDRVANALFVNHNYPDRDVIVIDSGTATTVDLITKDNIFQGGFIIPGLELQLNSLSKKTSLLPSLSLKIKSNAITTPKNSENAINFGVILSVVGGIEKTIDILSKNCNNPIILITGGNWKWIKNHISVKTKYIENLTVLGISYFIE